MSQELIPAAQISSIAIPLIALVVSVVLENVSEERHLLYHGFITMLSVIALIPAIIGVFGPFFGLQLLDVFDLLYISGGVISVLVLVVLIVEMSDIFRSEDAMAAFGGFLILGVFISLVILFNML